MSDRLFNQPNHGRSILRIVLGVFLGLTCLKAWSGPGELHPIAAGQIPDSGLQRKQLLEEARLTNQLLTEITRILKSGTIKVALESTDNNGAGT